jgi:hypothetical protein
MARMEMKTDPVNQSFLLSPPLSASPGEGHLYSRIKNRSHRHLLAGFSAPAALISAGFHLRVLPADPHAILRTSSAYLRAGSAGQVVHVGAAEHEVFAGLADLRAIRHQPNVMRLRMLATHVQAMMNRLHADVMAIGADANTVEHLGRDGMVLLHDGPFRCPCHTPRTRGYLR